MAVVRGLGVAGLAVICAASVSCGSGAPTGCVGSQCLTDPGTGPNDPPPKQSGCQRDSDCGDGTCRPDGTCSSTPPSAQSDACNPNPCTAGFFCANGACLPDSPTCKPADPACIFVPHGAFEAPVHQFWWPWETADGPDDKTGHANLRAGLTLPDYVEVMMTPAVIRLHPKDKAPAILFNTFYRYLATTNFLEIQGVLRAVSGVDGSPIWTAPAGFPNTDFAVNSVASVTTGDCKGDGEVCIITGGWDPTDEPPKTTAALAHRHGGIVAFGSDGRPLWVNREMQIWWGGAAIARLLGPTGPAQIVVGNGVVDGATGKTLCKQSATPDPDQFSGNGEGTLSAIADIDLSGTPSILTGNNAYKLKVDPTSPTGYTCQAQWGAGVKVVAGSCAGGSGAYCPDGFPAVANFAGYGDAMGLKKDDPHPQVVVVSKGFLRIQDWTGGILLSPIPLPADANCGTEFNAGGAPTIADFDGDGLPEIGIAAQGAYVVWKPGKGFIWSQKTADCSAVTGSSVFDFEGKGQATAVYGDQCYVRVYDGKTGTPLVVEKNQSCTAYEMPIVADLDGTGSAKIVIPTNDVCGGLKPSSYACDWYTGNGPEGPKGSNNFGLKVLASPSDKWVNTRSVWNQHTYHVTNVNLDGTLPYPEPNSWSPGQSNTFRQNVQGAGVFSAPDLAVCSVTSDMTDCTKGRATASVLVYNGGAKVAKTGLSVHLYAEGAAGTVLVGSTKTSKALLPGDTQTLLIDWPAPSPTAPVKLKAVIDEEGVVGDCHPENNAAESSLLTCPTIG